MNRKSIIRYIFIFTAALVGVLTSNIAIAEFDSDLGGWTQVVDCPKSSWDVCPFYHPQFYWGGTGPDLQYLSPAGWSTYATTGEDSLSCASWVNGSIVGGASYEEGQPSVAQGVDVEISTTWWDFVNVDFSTTCGHQHVSTYVWGWRYNGSYWQYEFVDAHQRTSYLNDQDVCVFKADGNPDYEGFYEDAGFAFGPEILTIENSPYVVLYTKTQATSHISAGCGEFGCFHRVKVGANYLGGPGINQPKMTFDPVTNDLTVEDNEPLFNDTDLKIISISGTLSIGEKSTIKEDNDTKLLLRSGDDSTLKLFRKDGNK